MAMTFERKQDLSIYYWLVSLFSDAPFITINDGYPKADLAVPTVIIEAGDIRSSVFELGNRNRLKFRTWYMDVYAVNKSQRDEISYRILDALENTVPIYDYDAGFPPATIPRLGCLDPDEINLTVIKVDPELTEDMYYRSIITFTTENTI